MQHHRPEPATSTPALLLSLSHTLDDQQCPLARQARRLARQLTTGARGRPVLDAAAFCLASLLEAADAGIEAELDDDALLCSDWDA